MKRLRVGVVNTISFIKSNYTVNDFEITLDKVVGTATLTLNNLTDIHNLDSCKDFISINIDLVTNDLEGGEYHLTLSNNGNSIVYLCNVVDHEYTKPGTSIYGDTVVVTDL